MTRAAFLYFPAGTSIQLPPTILQSIMKRRAKRILLSYVRKLFEPRPSIVMPLSRIPILKHMPFESAKRKKVTSNLEDQKYIDMEQKFP
jgi:hypothetical protein